MAEPQTEFGIPVYPKVQLDPTNEDTFIANFMVDTNTYKLGCTCNKITSGQRISAINLDNNKISVDIRKRSIDITNKAFNLKQEYSLAIRDNNLLLVNNIVGYPFISISEIYSKSGFTANICINNENHETVAVVIINTDPLVKKTCSDEDALEEVIKKYGLDIFLIGGSNDVRKSPFMKYYQDPRVIRESCDIQEVFKIKFVIQSRELAKFFNAQYNMMIKNFFKKCPLFSEDLLKELPEIHRDFMRVVMKNFSL